MLRFTVAWGIRWEHKGPHNQLWGPSRPREQFLEGKNGQQPFQVGKLALSLLLTEFRLFIGATMARLGPSFTFDSVSCSQTAPGADQAATAHWGQCWSPAADGRDSSQVEMFHTKSRRDPHMPTSDTTTLFSVHIFTTIIQLEKGMGKEFFIPKKNFHPQSHFQPLSCLLPFLWRVKGHRRRQWQGGCCCHRIPLPVIPGPVATAGSQDGGGELCWGRYKLRFRNHDV